MKIFLLTVVFVLVLFTIQYSQTTYPVRFELQGYPYTNVESCLLGLLNSQTIMFWYDSASSVIRYARSDSEMLYWNEEDSLENIISSNATLDLSAVVIQSGRILLTYKTNYYYFTYSDDNGLNWSTPVVLPVRSGIINRRKMFLSSLSLNSNQEVCFIHSFSSSLSQSDANGIYFAKSSDGINWSTLDTIDLVGKNGSLISLSNSKDILVYQDSTSYGLDLFFRISTDAGITWSERNFLVNSSLDETKPKGIKDQNNKVWIYYLQNEQTPFSDIYQQDIRFITSIDEGNNWSPSEKLTKYVGYDLEHNVSLINGRPILNFSSSRDYINWYRFYQIYSTYGDIEIDQNTKPFLYKYEQTLGDPEPGVPFYIRAYVDDDSQILSVKLDTYKNPPGIQEIIEMYDDGVHNDSLSGDHIYGASVTLDNYGDALSYSFSIEDDNNIVIFSGNHIQIPFIYASDTYLFNINNLSLPLDNRGILAAVDINGIKDLDFDESSVLFSGGFYLSGYNNGSLWANAVASASLVQDYQAGPVGSEITNPFNKIYIIKKTDLDFGDSWFDYIHAVDQGADFYDGNNDGSYNPVDLNGNNQWDSNEDRPDFLGDLTAWCVYNDGISATIRRWNDQNPMGIEIQQTLFGWGENVSAPVKNMIFIRYRVINKGTVSDKFDNAYFSCWADPDLGATIGCTDDLVGSDVSLNLGFAYNSGEDVSYGTNPPAFGTPFLQGPAAYIPGETFVDINGNGVFEIQIDVPLDTAYMFNGPVLGKDILPGAKNQELKSFIEYINGDPTMNDPEMAIQARNYMLGLTKDGSTIDPCNFTYGNVVGMDCSTIDPRFLFSGDPVTQLGWLNTTESDQRFLLSTGPFDLEVNKPVDIIACYLVGRGTDALNSVSIMKDISAVAKQIYQSNFISIPTGIDQEPITIKEFKLNQNFPNPFNPSTKISWQSPVAEYQTLKIYDVLGNEVATLVDEYKSAGSYEVEFDASKLSSGVYFYQIKAGEFVETKKMILIK